MRKLWLAFSAVIVLSFAVLGWTGFRIYQEAPPFVWTGVSIIVLLAGIGLMASYYASIRQHGLPAEAPANDPVLGSVATPSQRAVVEYFWVVSALIQSSDRAVLHAGLQHHAVPGHAALFGVYGMLGIGLMLFSLRALDPRSEW